MCSATSRASRPWTSRRSTHLSGDRSGSWTSDVDRRGAAWQRNVELVVAASQSQDPVEGLSSLGQELVSLEVPSCTAGASHPRWKQYLASTKQRARWKRTKWTRLVVAGSASREPVRK